MITQKYILIPLIFILFYSCAPRIHKTFGFQKVENLNKLAGTYSGVSAVSKRHLSNFNVLESFYITDEKAKSFSIAFPEQNLMILTYKVTAEEKTLEKQLEFKGKPSKRGFKILVEDISKNIPLIKVKEKYNFIGVGKNSKDQLIIKNYIHTYDSQIFKGSELKYYEDIRAFNEL